MHNLRIVQELGSQLQQCAKTRSLLQGKELHREVHKNGYGAHTFVANSLIQMYGSCQCLQEARSIFHSIRNRNIYSWTIFLVASAENGDLDHAKIVFNRMPARNLASWNALIAACARNDQCQDALEIFYRMSLQGERPDDLTFVSAIDSCGILRSLRDGKLLHEQTLEAGLVHNTAVANTLITMYGKCQRLDSAWSVFADIPNPDVVSWTSIGTAFARNGYFDRSLELFQEMPVAKNVVCWSAIITAAARCDRHSAAFQLFQVMDQEGARPNTLIYLTLLQGSHSTSTIRAIHCTAEEDEELARDSNPAVMNAVLSAYGRYGDLARSWAVFSRMERRDPITWNSIATACAQSGDFDGAMRALERMPQWEISSWNIGIAAIAKGGATASAISFSFRINLEGIKPDGATFIALIDSCASPNSLPDAKRIASWIGDSEFWSDPRLRDATIDMFGRCDDLDTARAIFLENPTSAAGWAKMVANYARNGDSRTAINLFKQMDLEGVKPVALAFVGAIAACSNSAALGEGEAIHACFEEEEHADRETEHGPSTDMVHNAAIHMYGRCGSLGRADSLFRSLRRQSVVSWTSIIRAFASNGRVDLGFRLFREMQLQGTPPSAVTMAELQSACAHLGLLRDGLDSLASMLLDHGIAPTAENYACIADLLRRSKAQEDEDGEL
ncbi:pentatricopeptide repeat-containing protein At4g20770 [Selaginella moellendorffii]|uniref:pentatricopeptide repeat-containing protein At4g20770 n=1 Tax=Selaginella moellendorffii TaxID=88036 RepID=UPI000D1C5E01|nr:pentatricopeptide repeat-containing protein At4g20770 [Selaginella moellendorffii]|eukprot:XP_024539452.1 pentatricopeptide repeat-containing protein At4g20770 [Selaginella moellendorffii]